jgi:hypothetical protein
MLEDTANPNICAKKNEQTKNRGAENSRVSTSYNNISNKMQTHWFYTVWPFIGIGGAIVMVAILLMTDTFRSNNNVSRWCDTLWLMWFAAPLYWVHQFEEYSLQTLGFNYSIQNMIANKLGYPPYPDCPIPLSFYPVVNISLMWFGALLAAFLGRRNVLIGLSFWGLLLANGLVHTIGGILGGAYNTGLWSGAFLFIPFSIWVIYASAIRGPYSGRVVAMAYVAGALTHVFLFMGYGLYKAEVIGNTGLLVHGVITGFMPIIFAAIGSRFFRPELLRPSPMPVQ